MSQSAGCEVVTGLNANGAHKLTAKYCVAQNQENAVSYQNTEYNTLQTIVFKYYYILLLI